MKPVRKNWLEWTVCGVGLALVLATLGYLAIASITTRDSPPRLAVHTGTPVATGNGYAVPVTVFNEGGTTAENVVVEVVLEGGAGEGGGGGEKGGEGMVGVAMERAELTLPYVPRHAARSGWVTFRRVPARAARISARTVGYLAP
ncbi:MAG: hypothetical protein ACREON_14895 [Gemmatimonadaceae bacterium]